jgi:hypothetical protein
MIKKGLELCREAFIRLKNSKPLNEQFKGKHITNSIVSQEAGFDAGYLKSTRSMHRSLINEITEYRENQQKGSLKKKIEDLDANLSKEKKRSEKFKKERDVALSREILLYDQICELEGKVQKLNNVSKLKMRD